MIKTKVSIEIQRPVSDVFAFVTDVRNFPLWFLGIIENSRPDTDGPTRVGTKFTQTNRFLGQTFDTHFTVTEYDPDKLFCVSTTWGPVPFAGCYHFEATENGTLLTDRHSMEGAGVFGLVGSLFVGRLKQQAENNLANLKRLMEATVPSSEAKESNDTGA